MKKKNCLYGNVFLLETLQGRVRGDVSGEIVLHEGDVAKKTHRDLFSFHDSWYLPADGDITVSILLASEKNPSRLHISAGWETILKIALWTAARPASHDVFGLMKKCGIADAELSPFRGSEIGDLFPWLYYGRRFDVLRRICNAAKARAESKIDRKNLLVYCHLVFFETGKIIASSL